MFNFFIQIHTHTLHNSNLIFHKSIILVYMYLWPWNVLTLSYCKLTLHSVLLCVSASFVLVFGHLLTNPLSSPGYLSLGPLPTLPPLNPVSFTIDLDYTGWQIHVLSQSPNLFHNLMLDYSDSLSGFHSRVSVNLLVSTFCSLGDPFNPTLMFLNWRQ